MTKITFLSSNKSSLIAHQALALSSIPYTQVSHLSQHHEGREKRQFLASTSSYLNQSMLSSSSEHFQPQKIIKSLMPSWNTLVFFEVSPVSFHQARSCLLFILIFLTVVVIHSVCNNSPGGLGRRKREKCTQSGQILMQSAVF